MNNVYLIYCVKVVFGDIDAQMQFTKITRKIKKNQQKKQKNERVCFPHTYHTSNKQGCSKNKGNGSEVKGKEDKRRKEGKVSLLSLRSLRSLERRSPSSLRKKGLIQITPLEVLYRDLGQIEVN